jgi:RHS repeat-associated protein
MLASTFMDLVLGVDIHFEMVPMPAPVPTPIPNPFVGMVFDPAGLLVGQVLSVTMALVSGKPPLGPVLINSMPATTVGTNAINSLGVPHILIPPGTAWAPMPKLPKPSFKGKPPVPGPPVAPEGDAISVFGSQTVNVMGTSAVRMGDKSMSCGEPVRLPSSTVLAIPKGMPVMIGGPPAISIMDALGALVRSKWVAGYLHDLLSRMNPGRLRNLLSKAVCFVTGHPVDVATGRVLTDHVDWSLPGPLPLTFERSYSSAWANRSGPLGHGWSHTLDQAVWAERGRMVYLDAEGRELEFDTFAFPDHVLPSGESIHEPISRLTLRALGQRRYEILTHDGIVHTFAPVEGARGQRRAWSRLVSTTARDGASVALEYDRRGDLAWVRDAAGRQIAFEHDGAGRLIAVKLPHPIDAGWQVHTRYAYDDRGDLVQVTDPLGGTWRFAYKQHLLVQETDRNGLSFYFAYDGFGEDAYCVRTWGDGGIYDHVIDYDKVGKVTCVTDSLGRTTTYRMNPIGCVVKVIDALGGATSYEYDERTLRKIKETSPTGVETQWRYDDRGNIVQVIDPGGAEIALAFDERNQPVRAVDAVKGEWTWGYDDRGRLIGRTDPLGRRFQFRWDGNPRQLVAITDPGGHETAIGYDAQGNLTSLTAPDGAVSRWQYDNLGRCTAAIDANGSTERRDHDALGRLVHVVEPDGNQRELCYDAEGNLTAARDRHHDVRFTYRGMGRLTSRREAETTLTLNYDTEERLIGIANEHGQVYRFELGATGQVDVEHGFDGIRRQYARDKAGRVTKVYRPNGNEIAYRYDDAGRIVGIAHSTGAKEVYAYRPDGRLVEATNDAATVKLERDLLGRLVRETVGDDWVASELDATGRRIRVRSSRGFEQRIQRDGNGQPVRVAAIVKAEGDGAGSSWADAWQARIVRDALGAEIERDLPGGVQSRWQRDQLGRPVRQQISSASGFLRAVQYTWDVNDRLRMIVDAVRGPIRYEHDAFGSLAAAVYEDGRVDLRLPDAVGNLFRTTNRGDRKYGAAGQLLESREPDGRVLAYEYDAEGNLAKKIERRGDDGDARVWTYHWNASGTLARVVRPDGEAVTFTYDALARRLSKTFRGRTTRWIWDGDVPLHEWVERSAMSRPVATAPPADDVVADELAARRLKSDRASRPSIGPPGWAASAVNEPGTREQPVTWLFDPECFAPMAKLIGENQYAIVTDHLGTPSAMYDAAGDEVWSTSFDAYGGLRNLRGARAACPFRWPGQYEDEETGLYYNRFRYYDPHSGEYVASDPIGLSGGLRLFGYVADPNTWSDPLGLAASCGKDIALGKDIPGGHGLKGLAAQTGSSWWRNWARDGVTRRTVSNRFGRAFHQAADRAEHIHFSLDGIPNVGEAVRQGAAGFTPGNFTHAELNHVVNNPHLLAKTTFYRNGVPQTGSIF